MINYKINSCEYFFTELDGGLSRSLNMEIIFTGIVLPKEINRLLLRIYQEINFTILKGDGTLTLEVYRFIWNNKRAFWNSPLEGFYTNNNYVNFGPSTTSRNRVYVIKDPRWEWQGRSRLPCTFQRQGGYHPGRRRSGCRR